MQFVKTEYEEQWNWNQTADESYASNILVPTHQWLWYSSNNDLYSLFNILNRKFPYKNLKKINFLSGKTFYMRI